MPDGFKPHHCEESGGLGSLLRVLDLSRCSLRGPLRDAGVSGLTSLVALVLDDNCLEGPLPARALGLLTSLQLLSLQRYRFTGFLSVGPFGFSLLFFFVCHFFFSL